MNKEKSNQTITRSLSKNKRVKHIIKSSKSLEKTSHIQLNQVENNFGYCANFDQQQKKQTGKSAFKTKVQQAQRKDQKQQVLASQNTDKKNYKKNQKSIQYYKSLLPEYLKVKYPYKLARIFEYITKLEKYLIQIPKKYCGDSFQNIQFYLLKFQNTHIIQEDIKAINYLVPKFYNYYKDPLNNLVIEHPKTMSLHIRKQWVKKSLYEMYIKFIQQGNQNQDVPIRQLSLKKSPHFYQIKSFKDHPKTTQPKLSKLQLQAQFIKNMYRQFINLQQKKQVKQLKKIPSPIEISQQQVNQISKIIREIYQMKKVTNIFKVTLTQLIDQKMQTGLSFALTGLNVLLQSSRENREVEEICINKNKIIRYVGDQQCQEKKNKENPEE